MADLKPLPIDIDTVCTSSNFEDVGDFHRKFDLHTSDRDPGPIDVTTELVEFRVRFLTEELDEFRDGIALGDHAQMFDALIDLVYVAMGTAHLFGYPWQEGWDEVQRANMMKLRATTADQSLRGGTWDVVKGPDWTPPDIAGILKEVGFE
jgi:predicted HAD superfamily Cof-like phosphohydrolase